ncbi:hypothetical protein JCM10449v2_002215 [Rhodotorula kratochvilovae]
MTSCGDGVTKCDSKGVATTCKTGYTRTTAGACIKCAADQTFDPASQTCTSTAASCATKPDHLYNTLTNFCEPICPEGTLIDGVYGQAYFYAYGLDKCMPCGQPGAVACDFRMTPLRCFEGYNMGDGWCAKCTADQDWRPDLNNCLCRGAAYTTAEDGKITVTRRAMYQDLNTNAQSCLVCPETTALTCVGKNTLSESTECLPGFKLVEGPDGFSCNHCANDDETFDPATQTCKKLDARASCEASGDHTWNTVTSHCDPVCPQGTMVDGVYSQAFYYQPALSGCTECWKNRAITCNYLGQATSCFDGYLAGRWGCVKCNDDQDWNPDPSVKDCVCRGAAYTTGADGEITITRKAKYQDPEIFEGYEYSCIECPEDLNALTCAYQWPNTVATACFPGYDLVTGGDGIATCVRS